MIQVAIDWASDGDTILVADGTFTGDGNKDLDFKGKAIVVTSENGPESTVIDCEGEGRGFYFRSGEDSLSVVAGFTIKNGSSTAWGSASGGGIYCDDSSPTITDCIITGNSADIGAGIYFDGGSPTITDCIITGNAGKTGGGGIHCSYSSSSMITDCIITGNAGRNGAGIWCSHSSPTITDCIIAGNAAGANGIGGGISCSSSSDPTITGNTITGNSAGTGGGISCTSTSGSLRNTIIWDNEASNKMYEGIYVGSNTTTTFTYCDIQGGWIGEGNIKGDPLFVYAGNGDYRLRPGSPCINAGDPDPQYNDPDGTRSDIGALYYQPSTGPRIQVSASAHDFDSTYVNRSEEWTLTLRNAGMDVLNVSEMSGTRPEFVLSHTSATIPLGDSLKVSITFAPTTQGTYQDTLTISSNDPDEPMVKITLSGEGFVLIGDFDLDADVDFDDFFLFAAKFGLFSSSPEFDARFDLDNSGRIDFDDLFLFGEHFGEQAPVAKRVARLAVVNNEARLRLVESSAPMGMGEWGLDVLLDGVEAWTGYGLRIRYDPETMNFVRAQDGADVHGGGGSLFLVVPKASGEVIVASGRMGGQAPRSETLLTRLCFKSIGDEEDGIIEVTEGVVQDAAHRTVGIGDLSAARWRTKPVRSALGQNRPNPFNPQTTIPYRLTASGWVRITVYDIAGRRVKVLVEGVQEAGNRTITWDGKDEAGRVVGSGVYVLRMQTGTFVSARKLVLIR